MGYVFLHFSAKASKYGLQSGDMESNLTDAYLKTCVFAPQKKNTSKYAFKPPQVWNIYQSKIYSVVDVFKASCRAASVHHSSFSGVISGFLDRHWRARMTAHAGR